jgi:hypothetical protein
MRVHTFVTFFLKQQAHYCTVAHPCCDVECCTATSVVLGICIRACTVNTHLCRSRTELNFSLRRVSGAVMDVTEKHFDRHHTTCQEQLDNLEVSVRGGTMYW